MPLDVRGCTRATMNESTCSHTRKGLVNRWTSFLIGIVAWNFCVNEEFLVSASHQLALIMSLPFVHTARRYYRLNGLARSSDSPYRGSQEPDLVLKVDQTELFRGSKSRNKVTVGEPAVGSIMKLWQYSLELSGLIHLDLSYSIMDYLSPIMRGLPGVRAAF